MGLHEQIDQDISQFFRDIENMLLEDQKKTLKNLLDKYCHLSTASVKWDRNHFDIIKGYAMKSFNNQAFPKKFNNSYAEFSTQEAPNVCLIEATIDHLNAQDCLKKLPKFNIKED